MKEYMTILDHVTEEITEKKSKFIADIFNVESVQEAEDKIKDIKKKYYDARHNCIAYRIIENGQIIEKASDDGEPSGTAGGPMLNILQKRQICNAVVIVTRYFGGILLGTGGLVRAYSEVTQKAIDNSKIIKMVEGIELEVILEYQEFEIFKHYCQKMNIIIENVEYSENIKSRIKMEKNRKNIFLKDLENKTLKILEYQLKEEKYINENVEENK